MEMSITLDVNQWNTILNILCAQPYKDVAQIIASIKEQGDKQVEPV